MRRTKRVNIYDSCCRFTLSHKNKLSGVLGVFLGGGWQYIVSIEVIEVRGQLGPNWPLTSMTSSEVHYHSIFFSRVTSSSHWQLQLLLLLPSEWLPSHTASVFSKHSTQKSTFQPWLTPHCLPPNPRVFELSDAASVATCQNLSLQPGQMVIPLLRHFFRDCHDRVIPRLLQETIYRCILKLHAPGRWKTVHCKNYKVY